MSHDHHNPDKEKTFDHYAPTFYDFDSHVQRQRIINWAMDIIIDGLKPHTGTFQFDIEVCAYHISIYLVPHKPIHSSKHGEVSPSIFFSLHNKLDDDETSKWFKDTITHRIKVFKGEILPDNVVDLNKWKAVNR